jgi:hypothetical protein
LFHSSYFIKHFPNGFQCVFYALRKSRNIPRDPCTRDVEQPQAPRVQKSLTCTHLNILRNILMITTLENSLTSIFRCMYSSHCSGWLLLLIDLSPYEWNFDLDKPGQKFHHSLKEHHKISNIPTFRCEML